MRPGPTGKFPYGKQYDGDKGEVAVALFADKERKMLRLDFGTSLNWLALPKQDAIRLAEVIKERAMTLPD